MTAPTLSISSGLQVIAGLALADLAGLWELSPEDLAVALMDIVPSAVDVWSESAAALAADWYDEQREAANIDGTFQAFMPSLDDLGANSLAGWARAAVIGPEPRIEIARFRVEGGVQKRMVNAANLTLTTSATEDPQARGYMRRTRPEACRFCRMVASRGGVYTRASATFACHEHCFCEAVPAWGGQTLPVKPYKASDRPSSPEDRARVRRWIAANL